MPFPKAWLLIPALLTALLLGAAGVWLLSPSPNLIEEAAFSAPRISPNADGQDDVTIFRYRLARNATVSLLFVDENGETFYFRREQRRAGGAYQVAFSGVVAGFQRAGETWEGDLQTRLLPTGRYTWTLTASTEDGETASQSGTLDIVDASADLPLLTSFEVSPPVFSPNQDGIRDRVSVNVYLAKPATLSVYLQDAQGVQIYLSERIGGRDPGEAGNHEFDYDGGVDQGFRPPADGDYTLYAVAQDLEGQRFVRTARLKIENSGLPQVEIVPQSTGGTVCFSAAPYAEAYFTSASVRGQLIAKPAAVCSELTTLTLPVGDMLVFYATVYNYGDTPIRTAGPFPGTVYNFGQRTSTLGEYEESGAWRFGVMCDTAESDYPWRWALASLDELEVVYDAQDDQTYYYLPPGARAQTWGAVRMTELIASRNPQPCWAGLIHEDVGIPPQQNNVGRREVELVPPAE
jgi:hypothetical protein